MDGLPSSPIDTAAEDLDINQNQTEQNEKRKFDLPPEYDETDSRWTLKYREPAPGLVELIYETGVYVNGEKLAALKKLSNATAAYCNKFARMLLTEIFTTNSLRTCSWTSETNNPSDIHSGLARPGLDEHAKNILLKFFQEYGDLHNWNITEYFCCLSSVRRTMLEMRNCMQKEDEEEDKYSDETFSLTDFRQTMLEMIQNVQIEEENSGIGARILFPPAEYNENDSRWTLRYQRPGPSLVELMPQTGVYVHGENLASALLLPNDCITLARKLLNQIFTLRALRVCSWAGPTAKDSEQPNFRPGLNENAMTTLLNFVAEFQLMNDLIVMKGSKKSKKNIEQKLEAVETKENSSSSSVVEEDIRESPRKKQKTSNAVIDETASSSRDEVSEGIKLNENENDEVSNDDKEQE